MGYWLLKSEPKEFSFADLARAKQTTWDGISNPTALKHVRTMAKGDQAIIYHTGNERACVGLAQITGNAYADPKHMDEKRMVVDVKAKKALLHPVTLAQIKADKTFAGWDLLRIGRLSVVPTNAVQWNRILELSKGVQS